METIISKPMDNKESINTSEERKELPLKEKVDIIFNQLNPEKDIKKYPLKIPRKAKANARKIKKGWMGILKIDENGNISGEKQKIEDTTLKLKDGTYHTSDGREILFWDGKFPVLIQPTWKLNPIRIRKDSDTNETYGQKYVMARMLKDAITIKSKGGNWIIWIIGAGIAFFVIKYLMGKF